VNTLRACAERLALIRRQLSGEPGPCRRQQLLDELHDVAGMLEASGRARLATEALARRVQSLEVQLGDRDPGERRRAICERLGIGRTRYYELRRVQKTADSPVLEWDD
jgi:hypothetical protein